MPERKRADIDKLKRLKKDTNATRRAAEAAGNSTVADRAGEVEAEVDRSIQRGGWVDWLKLVMLLKDLYDCFGEQAAEYLKQLLEILDL